MNQEKIGKFIANVRKEKKITQKELAEKLGVSDRTVGNWENGRNMPDLSLFKPLCDELGITINDLLSGEKVKNSIYQEKLEENIIRTIDYTNKKIESKNNLIGLIFIIFGVFISILSVSIFPSESSWSSVYSILGAMISMIGVSRFTKKLSPIKKVISNFGYFIIFVLLLMLIDYLGVINIHQAPRFSLYTISASETIYYDTPFYDVVRCNKDEENEIYIVYKNQKYDKDNIVKYCK